MSAHRRKKSGGNSVGSSRRRLGTAIPSLNYAFTTSLLRCHRVSEFRSMRRKRARSYTAAVTRVLETHGKPCQDSTSPHSPGASAAHSTARKTDVTHTHTHTQTHTHARTQLDHPFTPKRRLICFAWEAVPCRSCSTRGSKTSIPSFCCFNSAPIAFAWMFKPSKSPSSLSS